MTIITGIDITIPYASLLHKVSLLFNLEFLLARRQFCILATIAFFNSPVFSQHSDCGCRYQYNKFKAYEYSAQGKPDSALHYFKAAFSTGHAALNDLLMAADQAIMADSQSIGRKFIIRAFRLGLTSEGYAQFLRWSGRGKISIRDWVPEDTIEQASAQYQSQLNHALLNELKRLEFNDQRFRTNESDSPAEVDLRSVQDSINVRDLKKIVASLGHLPGYSEVGFKGVDILELLFLHMNSENLGWFLPHIIRQVRNCEYFDVDGLAYQIDRIAVSSGLALYINEKDSLVYDTHMPVFQNGQYYSVTGYWYDTSPLDGVDYFWPVFEPILTSRLKITRERLCLDTYEHYLRRYPRIKSVPISELKKLFGG
jgi:hypothetical protein